jgi:hypothetical protein
MFRNADIRNPFRGMGVWIDYLDREQFLKVKETLSRIGLLTGDNVLNQEVFLLHKRQKYALMHGVELEVMDGDFEGVTLEDLAVRNTVAYLLESWGLIKVLDPKRIATPRVPVSKLTIVPFAKKKEFVLRPIYAIGQRKVRS